MAKSQELIQQLLKAEQEADVIISKARNNRVEKLKEAKTSADKDLDEFRKQEEAKFKASEAAGQKSDVGSDLAKVTAQELQMVKQDYDNNKNKCTEYILQKVLEVPLEIKPAAMQAIQRGTL